MAHGPTLVAWVTPPHAVMLLRQPCSLTCDITNESFWQKPNFFLFEQGFFLFVFLYSDLIAATSRKEIILIVGLSQEYEGYISFCGDRQLYKLTWSQSAVY